MTEEVGTRRREKNVDPTVGNERSEDGALRHILDARTPYHATEILQW